MNELIPVQKTRFTGDIGRIFEKKMKKGRTRQFTKKDSENRKHQPKA